MMNARSPVVPLLAASFALFATCPRAHAEIPNRSPEELAEAASQIVEGKVERIYTSVEREGDYEFTRIVAEIAVTKVEKGSAVAAGDRVYVRYWRKRHTGQGEPQPGHYGHRGPPKTGDRIRVYLAGDRQQGFDVVSPNGFAPAPLIGR